MKNPLTMMKQVQELQSKIAELQTELETMEVEGISGAGLVKVTLTGKGLMARISIDPSLIKPDESEDSRRPHHRRPQRRQAKGRENDGGKDAGAYERAASASRLQTLLREALRALQYNHLISA